MNLDEFNKTELVQIAIHCGIYGASNAIPREVLIESINTMTDIKEYNVLITYKILMSEWLKNSWKQKADLQKPPFRPCPECLKCTDLQIVACYNANKDQIDLWKQIK